ncbi:hypothetical protein [Paracoccus laeviglucosivorans]|uniref:Uncharacterized protein n=1 Tax=Paracoccus laeviglucosivorans TaxID=1197861 RepID=A0A521CWC4_9RHOB|nr:hypothetical protein [Paracoccus laeviglucosivorans]SMO62970.1 hypothetical protein SAMN06265221_105176 [Paracoccus laeviglucosivorans]
MRARSALLVVAMMAGLAGPVTAQDTVPPAPLLELAAPETVAPDATPEPAEAVAPEPAPETPAPDAAMPEVAPDVAPAQEAAAPTGKSARDERLWTCETSIAGARTEIKYVRDDEFRANVGRMEKNFSGWGKISCPGYVTLREILRRNAMGDDGSYCLLWDSQNDTYIGAQQGPRKNNAVCRKTFCERVNSTRAATFRNANAMAVAGYDAITQRPGAAVLAATSGSMVGTLEAAGAAAMGVAASPVAVGSMVIGSAAVGGTMWYCSEG